MAPGFDHQPSDAVESESTAVATRNRRIGLWLFAVYLVLYGGFVWLNAFRPDLAEREAIAGLNLAVSYGFGLILAAFALAMLYGLLCALPGRDRNGEAGR